LAAWAGKQTIAHASQYIQSAANTFAKTANDTLNALANILHTVVAANGGSAAAAGIVAAARAATGNIHHS